MADPKTSPTKRPKRTYSAEDIGNALAVLKSNKGNLLRTAKELGIPRLTLREWEKNNRRDSPEVRQIQHEKEQDMLKLYGNAERTYLEQATRPEIVAKTSGLDAMKAAGIARDKQQILNGQPTSISASVLSEDQRRLRLVEILTSIAARTSHNDSTPALNTPTDSSNTP